MLPVGAPIPCYECHAPHGSARGNSSLIADTLGADLGTDAAAAVRTFCFTCHTTADTGRGYKSSDETITAITGADTGGGIVVNGFASYLGISNNRVANNSGVYGGGIRVGHPLLTNTTVNADGLPEYTDGQNDFVKIHHNTVNQNGALDGAGAGISMCTGSDSYAITRNWVCGNFNTSEGGGIGPHYDPDWLSRLALFGRVFVAHSLIATTFFEARQRLRSY